MEKGILRKREVEGLSTQVERSRPGIPRKGPLRPHIVISGRSTHTDGTINICPGLVGEEGSELSGKPI